MIHVEPPPVTPARFGLLEAAAFPATEEHALMGIQFQTFCGEAHLTVGACLPNPAGNLGDISVNVGTTRNATVNGPTGDAGSYVVDWGDGSSTTGSGLTGRSHTYAADGTYQIKVTGPTGYSGSVSGITVTSGTASGPFTGAANDKTATKETGEGPGLVEADPFAVYHLASCLAVGASIEEQARRSFDLAEGTAVEEWWADWMTASPDLIDLGALGSAEEALAAVEDYAGAHYGGAPLVHMTRGTATLLGGCNLSRQGARLETTVGSRVVAGGGYLDHLGGTAAPGGTIFATGQIVGRRGEVNITDPVITQSPPTNEISVLVERAYVLATECLLVAASFGGTP